MFDPARALEMLNLCMLAETARGADFKALPDPPTSGFLNLKASTPARPICVDGAPIHGPVGLTGGDFKSDTECFVARSEADDVVVAFRSSETGLFKKEGAFKDWVLTDFRANRIPYPPAPGSFGDRRWVHAGFWQAYEQLRNRLLAEVGRQAGEGGKARRVWVTGFSLGGALALLAALDIAEALPGTPVFLYSIAAPRAGDASLNKLLAQRVRESFSIGFRGDPTIHLPPIGPNFPVTFTHVAKVNIAGLHIPLGKPVVPQFFQQYQTADRIVYIDADGKVHHAWPKLQVALNGDDHDFTRYRNALLPLRHADRVEAAEAAAAPRHGRIDGALQLLLAPPA